MNTTNKQDEAAKYYAINQANHFLADNDKTAFKNGAAWQKEQDKVIIDKLKSSLVKIVNWHKVHEPLSFIDGNDLKEAELLLNSLK